MKRRSWPSIGTSRWAGWRWNVRNDLQLALGGDDLLDGRGAERPDQLVLEILDAGVEAEALHLGSREIGAQARTFEAPPDGRLLSRVVQARTA